MKVNEEAYTLRKMVQLISDQKTGNPAEFSEDLGISRSQLYVLIDQLNHMGAGIQFKRSINSFLFTGEKQVIVREPVLVV
ncbi:MAG TPA: hypothetical protein PLK12_14095 [Prolixibacteraceae bacterium]|nr:hypothetical protein [Prolixibacteraceae bacterium]